MTSASILNETIAMPLALAAIGVALLEVVGLLLGQMGLERRKLAANLVVSQLDINLHPQDILVRIISHVGPIARAHLVRAEYVRSMACVPDRAGSWQLQRADTPKAIEAIDFSLSLSKGALAEMRKRAEQIHARFNIISAASKGTCITLVVPLTKNVGDLPTRTARGGKWPQKLLRTDLDIDDS